MDRKEVLGRVIEAISRVQSLSGRAVGDLGPQTCPVEDIEGFDSLSGVEATLFLSELLKTDLPNDRNPFLSVDGNRALSVNETTDYLCNIVTLENSI